MYLQLGIFYKPNSITLKRMAICKCSGSSENKSCLAAINNVARDLPIHQIVHPTLANNLLSN